MRMKSANATAVCSSLLRSASGHVTRTEVSSSRMSNCTGRAGPVDSLPERVPHFLPALMGAASLTQSKFHRHFHENYNYDDKGDIIGARVRCPDTLNECVGLTLNPLGARPK